MAKTKTDGAKGVKSAKTRVDTEALVNTIRATLKQVAVAKREFRASVTAFVSSAPALTSDRFWAIMADYRHLCALGINSKETNPARNASVALAHRAFQGEGVFGINGLVEVAAFSRQYEALADELGTALDKQDGLELGKGDDSFSDFCDVLPLAGEAVCRDIIAGKFRSYKEIEDAVRYEMRAVYIGGRPLQKELSELVMDGESYHESHLSEALVRYLVIAYQPTGSEAVNLLEDDDE